MSSLFRPKRKDEKTGKIVTSKTYYVSAQDRDGNWRRVSTHCQSPAAAKIKQKQIEADLAGPKIGKQTLSDFLQEHLKKRHANLEGSTWRRYSTYIDRLTEKGSPLYGVNVDQVDSAMCYEYVEQRRTADNGKKQDKTISKRTVNKEIQFLKHALKSARMKALIAPEKLMDILHQINPRETPELRGASKNKETWWKPAEIDAVLAALDHAPAGIAARNGPRNEASRRDLRDAFLLSVYTGLRRGNVQGLREGHCNLTCDAPVLRIPASETKTGVELVVRLSPVAAEIVRRRHSHSLPETPQRRLFKDFASAWKRLLKELRDQQRVNPETVWHDMRRSFVTFRLAIGVPIKDVQEEAGHITASMTADCYGRAVNDPAIRKWAWQHFAWDHDDPSQPFDPSKHFRYVSDPTTTPAVNYDYRSV